ncbi:unnamed protein product [Cuscuta campestris]|uniref:Uncharacterized protein n=1 Tax=Cuscuta campestris TaxID=132261 RepID=A0A484L2X5_9ASTE|nr:unnamed protein product [Cuscuta campestris]
MSSQSSVFRQFESEHGAEGSVTGSAQENDSRSPFVKEIVEAVEIPLQSEPRNQRRTILEDSGIRARKCTLTREEFRKAKRLASAPGVTVHRPTAEQSVFDAPPGFFAIHLKSLEYGFRFPLHQLVIDFFLHFDFLPCQVVPKSHRYLAGFLIRCQGTGVCPDLARFLLLFRLAKSSGRANSDSGSYASIFQRQEKLFKTRKDSAKSWKGKFVFVSLSSGSPFRKEPLSSFRRRSAFVSSDKMLEDVETLCRGGPFEVGSIVTNDALAALGFVFLSPEETQRSIEESPSGEIMLSSTERMKLMFPDAPSGNSWAPTRSPLVYLQAMMRMVDITQRLRICEADRSRAYVEIADLNEALKVAKEQARQAEERAQQLAEEAARQARNEAREQAVAEFISSGAFQDEAFARMNDLLKAWGQTDAGRAFAHSEGTQWYNLGLFRAQQVLSDRFLNGEDFPEPCDNPDELDTSIYYPSGGDAAGEQTGANEARGETFSFGSYSLGGSSAIPTKSGPTSTPPPSLRDSWDSDSESESVHPDPSAKIPGFIYYSSEEDEKTPSPPAPPVRRAVVAPPVPAGRGGRGRHPPAPPAAVPNESSVASHHPSRCSLEEPGSPSHDESTGHSVVSRAPLAPYPPPFPCKRG